MKKKWSDFLKESPEQFMQESVVGLFRKVAAFQPDKVAVKWKDQTITYADLEKKSNQVARYILGSEIKPGSCIAVMTGRSIDTVAGILGIWKCGCAYCFIDREYPPARNRECVEECGAKEILDSNLMRKIYEEESSEFVREFSNVNRRAVIVYTSGSTTRPKGVNLTHRNITVSISNYKELGIDSDDVYCCFSSFQFVASVFDVCLSLCVGCTLNLIPRELRRSIKDIAQYYIDNQITVAFLPPHMAVKYQAIDEGSPLKLLICGSEPARDLTPRQYRIAHVYASTEACAVVSIHWIKEKNSSYPVGKPVPTICARLVDSNGNEVPRGETGDLWISGPQITNGYLAMDAKKNARFQNIRDPKTGKTRHIFKTGDLMHWNSEGELVFDGRLDHMVKVRGFRIELEVIDLCIRKYEGIIDACTTIFKDAGGENILFAYYISDTEINHENLRAYIGEHIPYYMIPTGLLRLKEFPRTETGKVNRKGFPIPPELNDHKALKEKYK